MAEIIPTPNPMNTEQDDDQEDAELTFEDLGLEPRLIRALSKKDVTKTTPIQRKAIPLILEGKDVVTRAKTGPGKTFAYLLPMLQKLFSDGGARKSAPGVFILVPSRELCQQVHSEVLSLLEFCRVQLKAVQLLSSMTGSEMNAALMGPPDILISTPACVATCISKGLLEGASVQESLIMLVLDYNSSFASTTLCKGLLPENCVLQMTAVLVVCLVDRERVGHLNRGDNAVRKLWKLDPVLCVLQYPKYFQNLIASSFKGS